MRLKSLDDDQSYEFEILVAKNETALVPTNSNRKSSDSDDVVPTDLKTKKSPNNDEQFAYSSICNIKWT